MCSATGIWRYNLYGIEEEIIQVLFESRYFFVSLLQTSLEFCTSEFQTSCGNDTLYKFLLRKSKQFDNKKAF